MEITLQADSAFGDEEVSFGQTCCRKLLAFVLGIWQPQTLRRLREVLLFLEYRHSSEIKRHETFSTINKAVALCQLTVGPTQTLFDMLLAPIKSGVGHVGMATIRRGRGKHYCFRQRMSIDEHVFWP